ncbi:BppU family phage baseplate upper protein [Enterococcus faecium]|uniref:BppU family phage baseplate upper protein n=1 Tax=Enterococcus faecium TaxID=1352 RepID=UPI000934500F|nr:BppU family phage baseplate upper protein [Enterococcus faecium]PHL12375.1 hypothetical protein CQR40_10845 [Enterococcus faecium]
MASSLYNLALDFSKELNYTKAIMARQGDKGITVTVKPFLNGLQMDTSGGTFTLKGTTPSNRYVDSVATSVTSEEVTFSLDGTFMSEAGYYKHCYVEYRKGNQILTTQDIIFFSLGVSDISQGQADEYVSQLEELIRKYNETFDAFKAEIKGRVDSLNQQITDLTGQAKTLQDKLDALKEEISKLGNLQVMYSNSIDFGDYDYSGNPNLLPNLKASDFNTPKGMTAEQVGSAIKFTFDGTPSLSASTVHITALAPNTYYTLSADVTILDSTGADTDQLRLYIRKETNSSLINLVFPAGMKLNEKTKVQLTGNSSANTDSSQFVYMYMTLHTTTDKPFKGSVLVENIKLEKAISAESKATPYQPNLLDAPYYFSKVALGENIADPTVKFPITSSSEGIYSKNALEDFVLGETYTVTIGATKPASQTIRVYLAQKQFSDFKPVEGLVDTWVATVSITQLGENAKGVYLFQTPNTSLGSCTIKWLKIEKGDTRTPNIEQYKYRGIGMRDSNNPKDYVWDLAPEYVEDNLATDVKISEITGKANNYTDGKVSEINSQLTASINEVDKKVTANTKSITTINSTLTEMQKPVKYEAWFSGGTELRPANSNSRFRVSEERLTIGTKLNVAMNESPLEWNADRWEATFTRECSILVDVQTMVEFADQWGTYVYINMWKDTNQTQTWDTGYGMGIASGANFWFRTELSVSMYCMNAKVGDKFSIGLGMASGKSLTSARIHKLHIMEL